MEKLWASIFVSLLFFLTTLQGSQSQLNPETDLQMKLERCKQEVSCSEKCADDRGCQETPTYPYMFVTCGGNRLSELIIETHLSKKTSKALTGFMVDRFRGWKNGSCEGFLVSYRNSTKEFIVEATAYETRKVKPIPDDYRAYKRVHISIQKGDCIAECDLGETNLFTCNEDRFYWRKYEPSCAL